MLVIRSVAFNVLFYLNLLVQIGLIAGVTALSSRRTVNRTIETMH